MKQKETFTKEITYKSICDFNTPFFCWKDGTTTYLNKETNKIETIKTKL